MQNKAVIVLLATVLYLGTIYSQGQLTRQALRFPTQTEIKDAINF